MFVLMVVWALMRGAARSGSELLWVAAFATALVPLSSLMTFAGLGWSHGGTDHLIDIVAAIGAVGFAMLARAAKRRANAGPRDSVWAYVKQDECAPAI